jgi:DNA-directed RNA polymerase omega subunit
VGDEVPLLPWVGDELAASLRRRRFLAGGRLLPARDNSVNDFYQVCGAATFLSPRRNERARHPMNESSWNTFSSPTSEGQWPGIESVYRLIVVAALRNKQLTRGATPRIETNPLRHRNTTIALEEVKRGLVPFTITGIQEKSENDASLLL